MGFWSSSLRRGRKDHQCENCGRIIPKGELGYAEAGTVDGDFNSYRSCVPCHDLVRRLYNAGLIDSDGYQFDLLPELAEEAGEPWPPVACDSGSEAKPENAERSGAVEPEGAQSGYTQSVAHRPNSASTPVRTTP